MAPRFNFLLHAFFCLALATTSFSLSPKFYDNLCPQALPAIKRIVEAAVHREPRMGAFLLRLHFHDCFVNNDLELIFFVFQGCDGSLLLDSSFALGTEKNARGNFNSVRGFEVVDQIKFEVDRVCGRPTVSCADILAVVARDSVLALGGPTWKVRLGRRDSTTASRTLADSVLPSASMDLPALINNFKNQGLNKRDLVALSGGHTIGLSQCLIFRNRIYNATNIDPAFAKERRATCPRTGGNTNLAPFDPTPARFDTAYFKNLVKERGLLTSDQALFSALPAIKRIVEAAVHREPRMGASLLRLHFHDCFVNLIFFVFQGCDGSLLLDSTSAFETEKNARGNFNSVRGFEVVDQIKAEVDRVCGRPVVSCADILAVAARDSVLALGGPRWKVRLGRRDSTTASRALADSVLPSASMDLPALISNFKNQGLNTRDLVALSGTGFTMLPILILLLPRSVEQLAHEPVETLTSLLLTQHLLDSTLHTSRTW
ncbi:hypothetical protein ES332_A09G246600v1 [Gossypium tomentosum]|uniref:peroxidase n=1 Tax=Gossypium tomentosum TaxID=34277 RepID=A0A5D2P9K6_GOSTO|nr:hypothetical protein ES332_A09G246600v1 [Gossypium tomentosum]